MKIKKLSTKEKLFLLEAEKVFPKVWVWLQRQANQELPLERSLECLDTYMRHPERETVNPWAYLTRTSQAKLNRAESIEREESWGARKLKEEEDVVNWLKSFTKQAGVKK